MCGRHLRCAESCPSGLPPNPMMPRQRPSQSTPVRIHCSVASKCFHRLRYTEWSLRRRSPSPTVWKQMSPTTGCRWFRCPAPSRCSRHLRCAGSSRYPRLPRQTLAPQRRHHTGPQCFHWPLSAPVFAAIVRMPDRATPAHRPSGRPCRKAYRVERSLAAVFGLPGPAPVIGVQDGRLVAHHRCRTTAQRQVWGLSIYGSILMSLGLSFLLP